MPRTGENIYKRKDGRWEARIIVEYDPNGKAKYKYLYAKTYSEVKAKMIRVHSSIESSTTIITNKEASSNQQDRDIYDGKFRVQQTYPR